MELGPQDFTIASVARGVELAGSYGDPFDRSVARLLEVVGSGERERVF